MGRTRRFPATAQRSRRVGPTPAALSSPPVLPQQRARAVAVLQGMGTTALQATGLWLLYRFSGWLVARLHLPIPGNVLGLLLFGLLCSGLVRETWIGGGADLRTKHLAFFFIPIAVGLMEWGDLLWETGHWLLLSLVVSSLVGLWTTGGLVQLAATSSRRPMLITSTQEVVR